MRSGRAVREGDDARVWMTGWRWDGQGRVYFQGNGDLV